MKNLLFLVAITFTMLFTACSKNDESKLTDEEKALAHQEEMYQAMKKDIIGHWKGAQRFDRKWSGEWEDIPYGGWDQEYIFNSDGTFTDIYTPKITREGTYSILKNEDYAKNTTKCELFLIITTDMYTYGRKQAIWMEDKYLRIVPQSSGIPSNEYSGGEASIRYKKE